LYTHPIGYELCRHLDRYKILFNMKRLLLCVVAGLMHWGPTQAATSASTPFMPTWQQRHALQRLVDEAGLALPMTHWPLPTGVVQDALEQLPVQSWGAQHPEWAQLQRVLLADLRRHVGASAIMDLRNNSEAPVGFGDNETPGSSLKVLSPEGNGQTSGGVSYAYRLGLKVAPSSNSINPGPGLWGPDGQNQARPEGSAAVVDLSGWNLQAFSQKFWWGPGWQNSMILGSNAPAWNGVGIQRNSVAANTSPWWRWMGPWNLELFAAQAQDPWVVSSQPRGFVFSGFRLTMQPQTWLEVGLSRAMQFGGNGRAWGLNKFDAALLFQNSHTYDMIDTRGDLANSLAGFDVRVRCPQAWGDCAFYTQWMGEDTTAVIGNHVQMPWRYTTMWGMEKTYAQGRYRVFAEYENMYMDSSPFETYRADPGGIGSFYSQGETNGARWIASYFGGGSEVTTLGWMDAEKERVAKFHMGRTLFSVGAYSPSVNAPHGNLYGVEFNQTWHWQSYKITPAFSILHLGAGQDQLANKRDNLRLGVTVSRPL
jgi:Capsule assembly protein Wzi